jgi:WD40 repeat protein
MWAAVVGHGGCGPHHLNTLQWGNLLVVCVAVDPLQAYPDDGSCRPHLTCLLTSSAPSLQTSHTVPPPQPSLLPPQAVLRAHDSPIQCLEPCPEHQTLATSCAGNKVHIWSTAARASVTRAGVLDHQDPRSAPSSSRQGGGSSSKPASGSASPRTGGLSG